MRKVCIVWGIMCVVICLCMPLSAYAEEYEYDKLNRVTKVMYDDGSYVEYEYDSNGNITKTNVVNKSSEPSGEDDKEDDKEDNDNDEKNIAEKIFDTIADFVKGVATKISNWFKSLFK